MQPKTVIFDLDGTLVHSAPDLHLSANAMLSHLGRSRLSLDQVTGFVGNGIEKLVEWSLQATGGSEGANQKEAVSIFKDCYRQNLTTLTRAYPGVEQQLQHLQELGLRLAVCTNKPTSPARDICATLGLSGFFDQITGAEDGVPKKPDPTSLLSTIQTLGSDAQSSLYVGDSETDYRTAANAGVRFALFSGGYRKAPVEEFPGSAIFGHWDEFDTALRQDGKN